MSIKVMSWVWENGPQDPVERLVLLALADFADDHGSCYPSMIGIGAKACVTERGARGIVRRLEAAGWVETHVGGGRGGKSRYQIVMDKGGTAFPDNKIKAGTANREYETRNIENPERGDTKPGTWRQETRNQRSAEPSRTIKEPSDNNTGEAVACLAEVVGEDLAKAFVAHRKASKSPLTVGASQLIAKKLAGFADPAAAIETSIMNGWKGVFPERPPPAAAAPTVPRIRAQLPKEARQ